MKRIMFHPGHAASGRAGCGAVGYLDESTENRRVMECLRKAFKDSSSVYFYEVNGISEVPKGSTAQKEILKALKKKINVVDPDISISIHLNAASNPKACGTRVYVYRDRKGAAEEAAVFSKCISQSIGLIDGGFYDGSKFAIVNGVSCPSIILECCFVTSMTDAKIWDPERCANGIINALEETGYITREEETRAIEFLYNKAENSSNEKEPEETPIDKFYRVQCGAFKNKSYALSLSDELKNMGFDNIIV